MSDTKALQALINKERMMSEIVGNPKLERLDIQAAAELKQMQNDLAWAQDTNRTIAHSVQKGAEEGYRIVIDTLRSQLAQTQEAVESARKLIKGMLDINDDGAMWSDDREFAEAWLSAHEVIK